MDFGGVGLVECFCAMRIISLTKMCLIFDEVGVRDRYTYKSVALWVQAGAQLK